MRAEWMKNLREVHQARDMWRIRALWWLLWAVAGWSLAAVGGVYLVMRMWAG